jgi:[ribosomal protein S18]-alanine N-acetyltransferase
LFQQVLFQIKGDFMGKITIRPATDRERELAAHLLADSEPWITLRISLDQCLKNCYDPEYQLFIAYSGNKPTGIILIDPRGVAGSPYIKSIAVYPEFRGTGTGTALLSYAEDLFRDKARYIFICVSSFNHRARKLYERFGFQVAGELKDYIIDGASEILMQKRL